MMKQDARIEAVLEEDLKNPEMSLENCAKKLQAEADNIHKQTKRNPVCLTPLQAEKIIRILTSFIGNLNNFNVIYLLSSGGPVNTELGFAGGVDVGHTDLLITWLYKMTLNSASSQYHMASVIGILMFLVCAVLSLVVYNIIPSTKNEEDFG